MIYCYYCTRIRRLEHLSWKNQFHVITIVDSNIEIAEIIFNPLKERTNIH